MTPPRGRCSVCGRSVALRGVDGKLRKHGFGRNDRHCPGSGTPPETPNPEPPPPRLHDRRTQ